MRACVRACVCVCTRAAASTLAEFTCSRDRDWRLAKLMGGPSTGETTPCSSAGSVSWQTVCSLSTRVRRRFLLCSSFRITRTTCPHHAKSQSVHPTLHHPKPLCVPVCVCLSLICQLTSEDIKHHFIIVCARVCACLCVCASARACVHASCGDEYHCMRKSKRVYQ